MKVLDKEITIVLITKTVFQDDKSFTQIILGLYSKDRRI